MDVNGITKIDAIGDIGRVVGSGSGPAIPGKTGVSTIGGGGTGKDKSQRVDQRDGLILPAEVKADVSTIAPTYAKIRFDPDSRLITIKIYDATNDQVIREIPPDEVVKLSQNAGAHTGTLVEKKR